MKHFLALSALLVAGTPIVAQDRIRTVPIQFAKGASSKAIKGSVRGYDTVNYTIAARAGQTMTVRMTTANASSYFNVTAPGADAAMFIGSTSGNRFTTTIPSTGTYTIQVYLMRNAARRGEAANFTLNVAVL